MAGHFHFLSLFIENGVKRETDRPRPDAFRARLDRYDMTLLCLRNQQRFLAILGHLPPIGVLVLSLSVLRWSALTWIGSLAMEECHDWCLYPPPSLLFLLLHSIQSNLLLVNNSVAQIKCWMKNCHSWIVFFFYRERERVVWFILRQVTWKTGPISSDDDPLPSTKWWYFRQETCCYSKPLISLFEVQSGQFSPGFFKGKFLAFWGFVTSYNLRLVDFWGNNWL